MNRLLLFGIFFVAAQLTGLTRAEDIRVVVWDEQQPRQKKAYDNFLGNSIASHLEKQPGIRVRSMRLDDAEQGLTDEILDFAQVLVWWGHARQAEITPETGKRIVDRIEKGQLSLVALHSAHWSTPFVEAMYARTRADLAKRFPTTDDHKVTFELNPPPQKYTVPAHGSLLTPAYYAMRRGRNATHVRVDLPNCCFPDYRPDGKPSTIRVLKPDHPIAAGLPSTFTVPQTEMYNEPFHVPTPDEVIFKETWKSGEHFRSGCVWNLGKGKVFYFRPGHETYPIYKDPQMLKVVENAARWLATPEK